MTTLHELRIYLNEISDDPDENFTYSSNTYSPRPVQLEDDKEAELYADNEYNFWSKKLCECTLECLKALDSGNMNNFHNSFSIYIDIAKKGFHDGADGQIHLLFHFMKEEYSKSYSKLILDLANKMILELEGIKKDGWLYRMLEEDCEDGLISEEKFIKRDFKWKVDKYKTI